VPGTPWQPEQIATAFWRPALASPLVAAAVGACAVATLALSASTAKSVDVSIFIGVGKWVRRFF
jgi:hypothetical protein